MKVYRIRSTPAALCTVLLIGALLWRGGSAAELSECLDTGHPSDAPSTTYDFGQLEHREGLLWRLSKQGGEPSFLYGTIHVADPKVTRLPALVRTHFNQAKALALELDMNAEALAELQQAMFYRNGRTLADDLSPVLFRRALTLLSRYGMPAAGARTLKPWAVFTTLSLPAGKTGLPLDLVLMEQARRDGKSIHSLETVGEQVAVFESLGRSEQLRHLRFTLCHHETIQAEIDALIDAYLKRDLAALGALSLSHMQAGDEAFINALLDVRNQRMVSRALPLVEAGSAFIAVGTLHLLGQGGMLKLFQKQGFDLEAVY